MPRDPFSISAIRALMMQAKEEEAKATPGKWMQGTGGFVRCVWSISRADGLPEIKIVEPSAHYDAAVIARARNWHPAFITMALDMCDRVEACSACKGEGKCRQWRECDYSYARELTTCPTCKAARAALAQLWESIKEEV